MKIKFVNGVAGYRGAKVIQWQGKMVAGYYTRYLYRNEKEIVVAKQRSKWFTILIFIHELAHYFTRELFSGEKQDRVNIWIDKHMIRPRDKK